YESGDLPASERESLLRKANDWYRNDPDPGIHGAAEWLVRRWKQDNVLKQIDKELATGKTEGARRWYLNHQGQTFVLIAEPVPFMMGSTPEEAEREGREDYGALLCRHIKRSFAIATKPVTVEQFVQCRKDYSPLGHYARTGDCPAHGITWYI